jgi:hypothetical protein
LGQNVHHQQQIDRRGRERTDWLQIRYCALGSNIDDARCDITLSDMNNIDHNEWSRARMLIKSPPRLRILR